MNSAQSQGQDANTAELTGNSDCSVIKFNLDVGGKLPKR